MTKAVLKAIGRKIAQERIRQGLTQEDLAGMAEIDRSFLSFIENGHNNFSMSVFLKIADVLKTNPKDFF